MARLIDADALLAELQKDADAFDDEAENARKNSRNYTDGDLYSVMGRADGIRDAMMEVYDAPTIDVVSVVHGEWENYKDEHRCSNCGEVVIGDWYDEDNWYDFCPNCGAKMSKESE